MDKMTDPVKISEASQILENTFSPFLWEANWFNNPGRKELNDLAWFLEEAAERDPDFASVCQKHIPGFSESEKITVDMLRNLRCESMAAFAELVGEARKTRVFEPIEIIPKKSYDLLVSTGGGRVVLNFDLNEDDSLLCARMRFSDFGEAHEQILDGAMAQSLWKQFGDQCLAASENENQSPKM